MPFSSDSGKAHIQKLLEKINPKTVLDVGAGCGTYADKFKKPKQIWTAIEIWPANVTKYKLAEKYDRVITMDVRTAVIESHDVVIFGDVLEHMPKEDAKELLARARAVCKNVIVSIPLGHYPQDEYDGNPHEKHITNNWTLEDLIATFGSPTNLSIDNEIAVLWYCKLKIAVYAISKNEEQFVKRFCESAKGADIILIADTGSTDHTVIEGRANGAVVHEICVAPWRFDMARDTALCLLPADIDVCISLDLDEELQDGWRDEIERVWKADTTRLRYKFDWGAGIAFFYEKIHARKGYRWHHPCHEYPVPDKRLTEVWAHTDMLLVIHKPDPTKSRGQYMDLLQLAVDEDPRCPRNAFYYARELTFNRRWQDAIHALNKYLAMPEATWINERAYAMRLLSQSFAELNDTNMALLWARKACAEAPNTREVWCELAMFHYRLSEWEGCFYAANQALQITNKELVYTMDPSVWGEKPHDLLAIAAYHIGMQHQAIKHGEIAVSLAPTDQRLQTNLQYYKGELNGTESNRTN